MRNTNRTIIIAAIAIALTIGAIFATQFLRDEHTVGPRKEFGDIREKILQGEKLTKEEEEYIKNTHELNVE